MSHPYKLMNGASLTSRPNLTSGATKRWSSGFIVSARAFPFEHGPRRREQNLQVGCERPRARVADVEPHHLVEGRPAASGDLPQTGDARFRLENAPAVPA